MNIISVMKYKHLNNEITKNIKTLMLILKTMLMGCMLKGRNLFFK